MSDNTPDVQTIRQALAEATPGPLEIQHLSLTGYQVVLKLPNGKVVVASRIGNIENANLFAHAYEWLRWAVDEIDRLNCLYAELATEQVYAKEQAIKWNDEAVNLREERRALQSQLDARDTEIAQLLSVQHTLCLTIGAADKALQAKDAASAKMTETLRSIIDYSRDPESRRAAIACLQSLKEPNP